MIKRSISGLGVLIILMCSFSVQAQNSPFSGNWKLNAEKSTGVDNNLYMSKINIVVKGDSLLTTRTYEMGSGEQYPFEENMLLNGAENKMTIYEMPRKSKASKAADGSIAFESTTTYNANGSEDNMVSKETWKVDNDILSIAFNTRSGMGETNGSMVFTKVR